MVAESSGCGWSNEAEGNEDDKGILRLGQATKVQSSIR